MENVPNIKSMGKGAIKNQIIKDFEKLGYKVSHQILLDSNYGVPQNIKRAFFFIGLKDGVEFEFSMPTTSNNKITSKEASLMMSVQLTKLILIIASMIICLINFMNQTSLIYQIIIRKQLGII